MASETNVAVAHSRRKAAPEYRHGYPPMNASDPPSVRHLADSVRSHAPNLCPSCRNDVMATREQYVVQLCSALGRRLLIAAATSTISRNHA